MALIGTGTILSNRLLLLRFLRLMSSPLCPKFICDILSVPLSCVWLHKVGSWGCLEQE